MGNFRKLENKFFKEIELHIKKAYPKIIGNLEPSTDKEDTNLSFDAKINDKQFSIRIRKHKYLKYPDLTIRAKIKNNGKTEIDKIKNGLAQVYFYAYMDEEEDFLVKVRMVDVNSIRILTQKNKFKKRKNNDGTEFNTYLFLDIKKENGAIYKYDK
jgi:hypothetical protein